MMRPWDYEIIILRRRPMLTFQLRFYHVPILVSLHNVLCWETQWRMWVEGNHIMTQLRVFNRTARPVYRNVLSRPISHALRLVLSTNFRLQSVVFLSALSAKTQPLRRMWPTKIHYLISLRSPSITWLEADEVLKPTNSEQSIYLERST